MENTKIEWCHHTFNPWIGCAKVSPGCAHCYAEALMDTRYGRAKWGPNGTRVRTSDEYWAKPFAWNDRAAQRGERQRVFCASLADVFEDREELIEWRRELFALIAQTPWLDWLILTKRPENIKRLWPFGWYGTPGFTWANVWLGVSVENQEEANRRIPELLKVPAMVLFLSMEPLLGPVDLQKVPYLFPPRNGDPTLGASLFNWWNGMGIDWVIVGGESGPHARPMHPGWVRTIRAQCIRANVPFFFKQWGGWQLANYDQLPNVWVDEATGRTIERTSPSPEPPPFLSAAVMRRAKKNNTDRLLYGMEWNEFPTVPTSEFMDKEQGDVDQD